MSEFFTTKLSSGAEVSIDLEKLSVKLKKRKDVKRFLSMKPDGDEYDELLAHLTGLDFETVIDLDTDDFSKIDKALARAIKQVLGVNPN